ncbi:hypothetical protein ACTA71_012649 [Dictyostelium dimigraforme]
MTESETTPSKTSKKVAKRVTPVQKSIKAGLIFPVGRIHRMLKNKVPLKRVSILSSVYLAAILEYLVSEVLELTITQVSVQSKEYHNVRRISPRHLLIAIKSDEELDNLIKISTTIAGGGVIPYIHDILKKVETKPSHSQQKQTIKSI